MELKQISWNVYLNCTLMYNVSCAAVKHLQNASDLECRNHNFWLEYNLGPQATRDSVALVVMSLTETNEHKSHDLNEMTTKRAICACTVQMNNNWTQQTQTQTHSIDSRVTDQQNYTTSTPSIHVSQHSSSFIVVFATRSQHHTHYPVVPCYESTLK